MPLKLRYGTKADVPAELAQLYAEREGAWVLDVVDGAVERARLDEMRDTNIGLKKQLADLQTRFSGIDPDSVRKLEEEKRRLEEERQLKAGEIDKVLETRLKSVKADLDRQVSALSAERAALSAQLTAVQIDQAVNASAAKKGLRPTASPDLLSRARSVFRLVDGVARVVETDGVTVVPGPGGQPMTIDEWVAVQVNDAPHLFGGNAGGGASGNGSGGAGFGSGPQANPFKRGAEWNITEQMRLLKKEPALAERLKASA